MARSIHPRYSFCLENSKNSLNLKNPRTYVRTDIFHFSNRLAKLTPTQHQQCKMVSSPLRFNVLVFSCSRDLSGDETITHSWCCVGMRFARRFEKWKMSVSPYVRGFLGFRLFLEFSWENDYRGWIVSVKNPEILIFSKI